MPTVTKDVALPAGERDAVLASLRAGPPPEHGLFAFKEPVLDWPPEVEKKPVTLGGIPGVSVTSPGARRDLALLHIHGGGFHGGSPVTGYRLMLDMKRRFGMDGFSVDYTLTPHKRAPAQVEECAAFYRAALALGYERLVLAGESAGGNLVICVTLWLKARGLPLPAAVAASSPVTDFTGRIEKPMRDIFTDTMAENAAEYLGGYPADDPLVSPIFGDFAGFPPLLLQAGSTESLQYDARYLGRLLADTDCDCTVSVWEGAAHAVGIDVIDSWHSRRCMAQIADFLAQKAGITQ